MTLQPFFSLFEGWCLPKKHINYGSERASFSSGRRRRERHDVAWQREGYQGWKEGLPKGLLMMGRKGRRYLTWQRDSTGKR